MVIGAKERCDGYLKGNGYIVSWCVGHLVELATPEAYDEALKRWDIQYAAYHADGLEIRDQEGHQSPVQGIERPYEKRGYHRHSMCNGCRKRGGTDLSACL
jgi:DNA topoisomerase IA